MNREIAREDVTNSPDLARLAEEVSVSKTPRYLEKDGKALVKVTPIASRHRPKRPASQDAELVFRTAAGSWEGLVDPERLKAQLKAARGSDRPPVEL
ncbi:MAG: hypothetical protein M3442_11930 [Chloroflexota bacterium]|nr:hypothetical protein [Chloroflexota bacterium]